jgi:hypothetical protein
MRYDKIKRKPIENNIIDFKLHKKELDFFDNSEKPLTDISWRILHSDGSNKAININNITNKDNFKNQINLMKELRYFFTKEKDYLSEKTLSSKCKNFKLFNEFLIENKINVTKLSDINYNEIALYVEYLKTQSSAYRKYLDLTSMLTSMKKYEKIILSSDVKNEKYPLVKFPRKSSKSLEYYTKNEFDLIVKTIKNIIIDYFEYNTISDDIFVKSSYWLISFCSGLNETALVNLKIDSFEIITDKYGNKEYIFFGQKNRGIKGYQISKVLIAKTNTEHLFDKIINKLLQINNLANKELSIKNNDLFIYYSKRKKSYFSYDGAQKTLTRTKTYKSYSNLNNSEDVTLSTLKIRNQWSNEMFDINKNIAIVSKMLGHDNENTTVTHYLNTKITEDHQIKFSIFQELLLSFSKNKYFNNWIEFQKNIDINKKGFPEIINELKSGKYDTSIGKCINKEDEKGNICESYLSCFQCENFSIVGERDLWKTLSFREALHQLKGDNPIYTEIFTNIDNILKKVNRNDLISTRKKTMKKIHPFWKNQIMIKTITNNYENK